VSTVTHAGVNAGLLAIAVGGAAVIGLVGWFGARVIGHEVLEAGWAVPGAVALHGFQLFLSALAWRCAAGLDHGDSRIGVGAFFLIRWIREAVNSLLPVAQLGGNLVGIRLLMHRGVSGAAAGAGTTLDLTMEALTQFLFTVLGIAVLATLDADRSWGGWLQGVVAAMALGIGGFILAQRAGILRIVEALARRLHRMFPSLSVDTVRGLHEELMRLQRDRRALLRATGLHLLAWLVGVAETWLILHMMGVQTGGLPTGLAAATVIESLGMAARSAGFVVPGALGVQEAGFILVCDLFGIGPDSAIALSMVKRVRELVVGLPGLAAWQWAEGRRLLRRGHTPG
jgi:putative membrane protein